MTRPGHSAWLLLAAVLLFAAGATAQDCLSATFQRSRSFLKCNALPVLGASLHWTHHAENGTADIAFRAPQNSGGWVAWGINTDLPNSMAGSSVFIASQDGNGVVSVLATVLESISPSLTNTKPRFNVPVAPTAEYSGGVYTIYVTVALPGNSTQQNTVWQAGPGNTGSIAHHQTSGPNLRSTLRLDFMSGQSTGASNSRASNSRLHRRNVIASAAGLGGGAVALGALVASWCRRRSRKWKSATAGGNYSYQTLVDATGNFSEENQLGSGGCGVVYKGILENKQEIAVKKLVKKELKELEREVSLVAQLQHENLVKFLGHCFQEGEMFLVYEYLMNKSISNYLKGSVDRQRLDWPKWLNIIKGVARGLTYLHRDSGKDIVHRDLKPSNVLLDSNFTPKIADFDLARGYNRERSHEVTHNTAGTPGYIAPECYAEGKFSTKSDVYSYGVMVLEILVGQSINKFDKENCMGLVEHVWLHRSDCRVGDMLDRDHLGLVNHEQMQQASRCVQVALLCVQKDRSARPAMDEVIHLLNGEMLLGDPSVPAYIAAPAGSRPSRHSVNGVTISVVEPRS